MTIEEINGSITWVVNATMVGNSSIKEFCDTLHEDYKRMLVKPHTILVDVTGIGPAFYYSLRSRKLPVVPVTIRKEQVLLTVQRAWME